MKKLYITLLLLVIITTSCEQKALDTAYYFVSYDYMYSYELKNDTLYNFDCKSDFTRIETSKKQREIIKSKKLGDLTLMVIEDIHSKKLQHREDRFRIIGMQRLSKDKIRFFNETINYTKDSVLKIPLEKSLVENKFGITLCNENYLKSFPKEVEIDSTIKKEIKSYFTTDLNTISANGPVESDIIKRYANTKTNDGYGAILLHELITRKLISKNINPIAGFEKIVEIVKEVDTEIP